MALAVTFLVVIVSLLKISVNAHENWDAVLAKRIVFAVDTSASMLLDDANIKVRQAISVWTKYLSPKNTSIFITQLKLTEGLSVENVAGSGLKTILPEKDFFGGTCLFCGLKEAAKVLEDSTAQDLVVLLMEERAQDAPHDTPEFALQSVQPRFRIFSVALTGNADPDLENLATATHGASDFVPEPSFARLLLTFNTLPVAKSYSIIATQECEEETADCPIEFELDESTSHSSSSLNVFLCPHTNRRSSVTMNCDLMNVDLDDGDHVESLNPEFDQDTGCWILQQENPQSGIWQLKVNSVNDSFSVAVVIQNPQYHKLHCNIFKEHGDIFLKATVEPPFENLELLDISAFVEVDDEKFEGVSMETLSAGEFSSCLKSTGKIGRHAISCKATKSGVTLLTSQSHSIKVDDWPANGEICSVRTTPKETTSEVIATEPANIVKDKNLWSPVEQKNENSNETQSSEIISEKPTEETNNQLTDEIVSETPAAANGTLSGEESGPFITSDSAQMIIFVVGGIILAEAVFILIRCRRKASNREQQRSLIPYSIDPKVNNDLRYQQVSHADVDEAL